MKFWTQLSDSSSGWVQVLSIGKFKHPVYGTIDITPDRIQKFVDNFNDKVRGIDLDVDYDHKMDPAKGRKAAGWIKELAARANGLFAKIDWTDEAKQEIGSKNYRYISADFLDKWADQEGKEHKDVLAGAGLTNRPFLKDMVPVNLSEIVKEDDRMDPELRKVLIKKYNLSDESTEAQILEKVNAEKVPDATAAEIKWNEDGTGSVTIPGIDGEVKLTAPEPKEDDDELKKLAETNPAIATILVEREEDRKRLKRLEDSNRLSEVRTQLNSVDGLPPVVLNELEIILPYAPKKFSDKVVEALKTLADKGFVPEQISSTRNRSSEDDKHLATDDAAIKKFFDAVDKVQEKDTKLSEVDAYELVASEQPKLYQEYEKATRRVAFVEEDAE